MNSDGFEYLANGFRKLTYKIPCMYFKRKKRYIRKEKKDVFKINFLIYF